MAFHMLSIGSFTELTVSQVCVLLWTKKPVMNPTTAKVKQFLADIESTAETILADKEQAVELDRRRQKNREALRALQKLDDNVRKPWVCIGNMFMKIPKGRTTELLQQVSDHLCMPIASNKAHSTRHAARNAMDFESSACTPEQQRPNDLQLRPLSSLLEQAKLEEEIASLRKKLKKNVQLLRELEGKSEVQGFSLEPLSREEMQAINKVMGS
ncbi:hypothetical protein HPB48_013160 [Haemaphysalis longicornis]|uniref:P53 and DNA damage-regulated protein 1 n=1 Tax=Haemaphysalis longicornis TaxID=44386 RepID=A0A9J6H0S3_HAELO|nr:hypothetical protein HPB48_013160 [Haemaphysalis longicornis]